MDCGPLLLLAILLGFGHGLPLPVLIMSVKKNLVNVLTRVKTIHLALNQVTIAPEFLVITTINPGGMHVPHSQRLAAVLRENITVFTAVATVLGGGPGRFIPSPSPLIGVSFDLVRPVEQIIDQWIIAFTIRFLRGVILTLVELNQDQRGDLSPQTPTTNGNIVATTVHQAPDQLHGF